MRKWITRLKRFIIQSQISKKNKQYIIKIYRIINPKIYETDTPIKEELINSTKAAIYTQQILNIPYGKSEGFVDYSQSKTSNINSDIKIFAYYLTQYHPTPENDAWWGRGVTEWNNVSRSVPLFLSHYQPRIPGELGYYDLRLSENIIRQAELAKQYGLSGFCFYYYWFDEGERILEKPLNTFLENSSIEIEFFYCWANHSWYKRFDGNSNEILIHMSEDKEIYKKFIYSVISDFKDERYYKIHGKPVLVIYEAFELSLEDMREVVSFWRKHTIMEGFPDLYLIAVKKDKYISPYLKYGYDAETEFHPRTLQTETKLINSELEFVTSNFKGQVYDYKDIVENKKYFKLETNKTYRSIMTLWDNTARKNNFSLVFHNSTPRLYGAWLRDIINETKENKQLDDNLIFINAWNEWGEGAYLEPDKYYGYAMLQETRNALENNLNDIDNKNI